MNSLITNYLDFVTELVVVLQTQITFPAPAPINTSTPGPITAAVNALCSEVIPADAIDCAAQVISQFPL
jgi:hypothetical protein